MIKIHTQQLRDAVQAAYDFDSIYGSCIDVGAGDTVGISGYEAFVLDDKTAIYYFRGEELVGYDWWKS